MPAAGRTRCSRSPAAASTSARPRPRRSQLDRRRQRLRRRLSLERHQRRGPERSSTCSRTARSRSIAGHRRQDHRGQHARRPSRLHGARGAAPERACRRTPPTSSSCPGRSSSRRCAPARWTSPPSATGRPPSRALLARTAACAPIFDDTDVLGEIAGGFVVLRRDFVEAHPEAARIFVEQSARAADWCAREPGGGTQGDLRRASSRSAARTPSSPSTGRGFGLREGAQAGRCATSTSGSTCCEREGSLPKGKLEAADLLLVPATTSRDRTDAGDDASPSTLPRRGHDP